MIKYRFYSNHSYGGITSYKDCYCWRWSYRKNLCHDKVYIKNYLRFTDGYFNTDYTPTIFDNTTKQIQLHQKNVNLNLWFISKNLGIQQDKNNIVNYDL